MADAGRRFRNLRIRQALRAFERLGYVIIRTRGSHYILEHPSRGFLILPFHRGTIKTGLILDALEKAGINPEEFEVLL